MRKFFLIPLMTLMCSVMAWGSEITVSNFADLKAQLSASGTADVVKLAKDIAYPSNGGSDLLNIERSLTLDGQGHKITGYAVRPNMPTTGTPNDQYKKVTLALNSNGLTNDFTILRSNLTITLKDLVVRPAETNVTHTVAVMVYDGVKTLNIDGCEILDQASSAIPLAIFGNTSNEENRLALNIDNSYLNAGLGIANEIDDRGHKDTDGKGYPIVIFKPTDVTITNSTLRGYCAISFKCPLNLIPGNRWQLGFGDNSNGGARGTIVNATNCYFNAVNHSNNVTNGFGVFNLEDDGVTINLNNCGMNATKTGNASQAMLLLNGWYVPQSRHSAPINLTISGDNSHINGDIINNFWHTYFSDITGFKHTLENGAEVGNEVYKATGNNTVSAWAYTSPINITINGGTYAQKVDDYEYRTHMKTEGVPAIAKNVNYDNDSYFDKAKLTIPSTHEVKTVNQGGVIVYRVVPKTTTSYNLNSDVPEEEGGAGQNPNTSFELSNGSAMTLDQPTTKAGYVEVSNATTVTVATDQTLVINNGLDVQGSSVVTAKPGSALVIGEGGIVTSKPENIVIEADKDGAASLLLDPTITVNQTPELTVKMTVPAEHAGYDMHEAEQYRHWFRFAMPVKHMAAIWAKEPSVPTYLYGWDYANQKWAQVGVTEMVPFAGYTLSPDQEITGSNSAVTYTFKGQLLGNTNCTLNLNHHGYNFFGNSYTGYISILKLVEQIMGDAKIDGTVWMWDGEKYKDVALANLAEREYLYQSWQKEVAPMQTFVLRLTGEDFSSTDINYADAIWGNPRYDAAKTALNAAPALRAEINDDAIIRMTIEANGQKESVVMIENSNYSDAYDRGYDAIKYMNENSFNTYVGINGENYGTVATDNLEGKMLNIKTNNELAYSITFDFVAGEEYALRDNATNQVIAIEEGATYEFAAQPNSTVEGRFEIVNRANMPTAIENTEIKANVKGIYTIMGQYLGENFDILPAGVYVVDGVKIVK